MKPLTDIYKNLWASLHGDYLDACKIWWS